jgi:uncharacterized damage-inducible protein DinB
VTNTSDTASGERADLVATLDKHRSFLLQTVRGIVDDDATRRTTVSELCLAGVIKHVALTEERWIAFILEGPAAMGPVDEAAFEAHQASFRLSDDETLAGVIERYEKVAHRTDELVAALPSLDASQPLPEAPWFERGARWSARRVLLHIIAETAQHAGHADILREALDGAKTMG